MMRPRPQDPPPASSVDLLLRVVPIAVYRPFVQRRRHLIAAGLMQATSLSVPVVAGAISVGLGLMSKSNYAALVAAGLLSVLIFPLAALKLLPTLKASDSGKVVIDL
jgi:hypothetical protein